MPSNIRVSLSSKHMLLSRDNIANHMHRARRGLFHNRTSQHVARWTMKIGWDLPLRLTLNYLCLWGQTWDYVYQHNYFLNLASPSLGLGHPLQLTLLLNIVPQSNIDMAKRIGKVFCAPNDCVLPTNINIGARGAYKQSTHPHENQSSKWVGST